MQKLPVCLQRHIGLVKMLTNHDYIDNLCGFFSTVENPLYQPLSSLLWRKYLAVC